MNETSIPDAKPGNDIFGEAEIKQAVSIGDNGHRTEGSDTNKTSDLQSPRDADEALLTPRIIGREARDTPKTYNFRRYLLIVLATVTLLTLGAILGIYARVFLYKPQRYINTLYYFQISDIADFTASSVQLGVECRGVTMTESNCELDTSDTCAYFQVCYLGTTGNQSLASHWAKRQTDVTRVLSFDTEVGLSRACRAGEQKLSGRETTIQGKRSRTTTLVAWYILMTEYEGRVYVIETVCPVLGCGAAGQGIKRMLSGITFESASGVVETVWLDRKR